MGISGLLIHVQISRQVDHPLVSRLGHIQISRVGHVEICGQIVHIYSRSSRSSPDKYTWSRPDQWISRSCPD